MCIRDRGGEILFVGTKKQAQESIRDEALRCGMHYVNCLLYTSRDADAMLGKLTEYFSQVDEPVILVFWGDHYNPIDSNYDIYTRSGYASDSSADPRLHQTTLLMWSNYSDRAVDLGTIAAYDISPVMMELFGLRQPLYFQFLGRQLRAAYRANTRGTIMEKDGTTSNELTPLQQKWRDEHWLLQYDLMFGKGYALGRMGLEGLAEDAD